MEVEDMIKLFEYMQEQKKENGMDSILDEMDERLSNIEYALREILETLKPEDLPFKKSLDSTLSF